MGLVPKVLLVWFECHTLLARVASTATRAGSGGGELAIRVAALEARVGDRLFEAADNWTFSLALALGGLAQGLQAGSMLNFHTVDSEVVHRVEFYA